MRVSSDGSTLGCTFRDGWREVPVAAVQLSLGGSRNIVKVYSDGSTLGP